MKSLVLCLSILISICAKPLFAGVTEDVDVKHVQTLLTELCYNAGPVDGMWGSKTETAAKSFFKKQYNREYKGKFSRGDYVLLKSFHKNTQQYQYEHSAFKRCHPPLKITSLLVDETFSKANWSYILPHRHNTSRKAGKVKKGSLKVTVSQGMHGASSDKKNNVDRAEFGKKIHGGGRSLDRNKTFFMQFDARVAKGFKATARTLISQIKVSDKDSGSPVAAFYFSEGGGAKCMNYNGSNDIEDHDHNHKSILKNTGIDVLDGEWHTFLVVLKIHDTEGYCKVSVDDTTVFEISNHDSKARTAKEVIGRIGIYRDDQPFDQTVYYDNWKIGYYDQ